MLRSLSLVRSTPGLVGVSLHEGRATSARIVPWAAAQATLGVRRVDLGVEVVPVSLAAAEGKARRTVLGCGGVTVQTAEHLLSALAGYDVVGALIEIDGAEPPLLDGSALPWVQVLAPSLAPALDRRPPWRVCRDLEVRVAGGVCRFAVSDDALVECRIDFSHRLIGRQRCGWAIGDHAAYAREIAPARTFGFLRDAERLRAAGLARGASLESVVVFDEGGLVSAELRFPDEPVRHKLLDVIGDLALLGAPIGAGVVRLERPSHRLLVQALKVAVQSGALKRADD